eukprot:GILJ01008782.1.p1 GENE.GILJ01008782.1~~GILJ01008782.1.p1  ORF type:complete len:203 (-),score=12.79 GILJ01008782.1:199-777(-)
MAFKFLVACVLLSCCFGYREDDPVHMLKRVQHQSLRTPWSDISRDLSPHFAVDRTVTLTPLFKNQNYSSEHEYKMSFNFDHERFSTSWITITDGKGTFLESLYFTLVYAGDKVVKVTWKTEFQAEELKGKRPEHIYIHYHWHKLPEKDLDKGLRFLFIFGLLVSGYLVFALVKDSPLIANLFGATKDSHEHL